MKQLFFLTLVSALSLEGGVPVVDYVAVQQRELQHLENVQLVGQTHAKLDQQITLLQAQVDESRYQTLIMGDPALVGPLPGAQAVYASIDSGKVSQNRSKILESAQVFQEAFGIYTALAQTFAGPDGKQHERNASLYRGIAAISRAAQNHDAVYDDATTRRDALRQSVKETLQKVEAATTDAEVQKHQAVLQAQSIELNAIDNEVLFAANQALLQDIEKRNALERQSTAQNEQQGVDIQTAFQNLRVFGSALPKR